MLQSTNSILENLRSNWKGCIFQRTSSGKVLQNVNALFSVAPKEKGNQKLLVHFRKPQMGL